VSRELPPPLPPGRRTVGQLVAETIRFYQDRFWRVLPLGFALAAINQATAGRAFFVQALILLAGAPLVTGAYVAASALVTRESPTVTAFKVGLLIWLPVPGLIMLYNLPAVAWLAFVGLAVPAAVAERLSFREALVRGRRLGTVDYVHALGSLATLTLIFGLTKIVLFFLLRDQADVAQRTALFLGDLVISPLLFVGSALLYYDQAARALDSRPDETRRTDADVHPAVEPDRPGGPDTEVESRTAPRGEP